jgi:hypothetical protein
MPFLYGQELDWQQKLVRSNECAVGKPAHDSVTIVLLPEC